MENLKLRDIYDFLCYFNEKNNKFPKLDDICNKFQLKRQKVISLLRLLEEKKYINRSGSNYFFPKKEEDKTIKNKKIGSLKITILIIVVFIVGSFASYMSVYYTWLWFLNMTDVFKAALLSLCIVGFNIIAFELILLFNSKKKLLSFIFVFLWIVILIFSMISTVAGQLSLEINKRRTEQISSIEKNNDVLLYEEYERQIEDIKIDIESKRKERDKLLVFIATIEFGKKYKDLNYRIYLKNKDIEKLQNKEVELQKKKEKLLEDNIEINVQKNLTFYEWLEKIFKMNKNIFQFILQVFPAIFLDIISPLSFGIVIFYNKL